MLSNLLKSSHELGGNAVASGRHDLFDQPETPRYSAWNVFEEGAARTAVTHHYLKTLFRHFQAPCLDLPTLPRPATRVQDIKCSLCTRHEKRRVLFVHDRKGLQLKFVRNTLPYSHSPAATATGNNDLSSLVVFSTTIGNHGSTLLDAHLHLPMYRHYRHLCHDSRHFPSLLREQDREGFCSVSR